MSVPYHARFWFVGLLVALGAMCWSFSSDFGAPWTDQIDGNGACWSQSAHNTLRAGLLATAGVPSAFYFGSLPIPPEGYYTHHPPLLSLLLAGMFRVLGEKEWVARLVPIVSSLASAVLLWFLVRICAGARVATFCVLALAAMPMELRYGRMVNFEALDLVWMLGALLALRLSEQTGERRWRWLACGVIVLSLWTAWLGYLFTLVLAGWLLLNRSRRDVRLGLLFVAAMAASLVLFLLEMHHVQPEAWREMWHATALRMAQAGEPVPWRDWMVRVGSLLLVHISPVLWLLALVGAGITWKANQDSSLWWLGWGGGCFFVMNLFYIVAFRNASSVHDYASFYFTIPVAIMAGVSLDAIHRWSERRGGLTHFAAWSGTLVLSAFLLVDGARQTVALRRPFSILSADQAEPADLIPELGRAIRMSFGNQDVSVICNFLPVYGPQLHYYAQHDLLPCVFTSEEWKEQIADPENAPVGGVIWMGEPYAQKVLAGLPPGRQKVVTICHIPFCFWSPEEKPAVRKAGDGGG